MSYEKSCGAVIYREVNSQVEYLIIKQSNGDFTFPKGHVEGNETEMETALREIKEEVNLDVLIDQTKRIVISYSPKEGVNKDVVYFLGQYNGGEVKLQESEVTLYKWLNYNDALDILTWLDNKQVLEKFNEVIGA